MKGTRSCVAFVVAAIIAGSAASVRAAKAGSCSGHAANPGFYHFAIGDANAILIADGTLPADVAEAYPLDSLLAQRVLDAELLPNPVDFSINVLYLELGDDRILFDTGVGDNGAAFGVADGALAGALLDNGIQPESITKVFLTHAHPDHIFGLFSNNMSEPAFPEATLYINEVERAFWAGEGLAFEETESADSLRQNADVVAMVLTMAAKVETFKVGDEIIPGVTAAMLAPYHTPGMTVFKIESGGASLHFIGDAVHHAVLSVQNPWLRIAFDVDPEGGRDGRIKVMEELQQAGAMIATSHTEFPGMGRLAPQGVAFEWKQRAWEWTAGVRTVCPVDTSAGGSASDDSGGGETGDRGDSGDADASDGDPNK